jgi:hypothetical protein
MTGYEEVVMSEMRVGDVMLAVPRPGTSLRECEDSLEGLARGS